VSVAAEEGANFLTHKLGPLPMWGWIVSVGAGAGIFWYVKSKAAASGTAAQTSATQTSAPDVFGASGYPSSVQASNVGGYDYAPADSFLQQLQGELGTIQGSTAATQTAVTTTGVPLSTTGQQQVQQAASSAISTTPPPVTVATAPGQAPVTASNPLEAAIESQYQLVLGRAADPSGLSFWENYYVTQGPQAEAQAFNAAAQKELASRSA
jgi:hypothetical protein